MLGFPSRSATRAPANSPSDEASRSGAGGSVCTALPAKRRGRFTACLGSSASCLDRQIGSPIGTDERAQWLNAYRAEREPGERQDYGALSRSKDQAPARLQGCLADGDNETSA